MRTRSQDHPIGGRLPRARRGAVLSALLLAGFALGGGRSAFAFQVDQSSEHDAGDEEMMMGGPGRAQPGQPAPRLRPGELPPVPQGIVATTRLNHTAIWVGDQFHYSIIVDYPPQFEFVLDGLTKETVNMDPFTVVDVQNTVTPLQEGRQRLFLDLTLASFTTGQNSEQIPQVTLFYFQKGGGASTAEENAAESLTVPGPELGIRSTLPPNPAEIRDAITVSGWDRNRWVGAGAGWFALFVLIAGAGWETAVVVRRRRVYKGPDRRKAMEAVRDRWASSVPSSFSDAQTISDFYDRCHQDLKEYLGYYLETPAVGLTAEELNAEMQRLGTDRDFAEKVFGVLDGLESARYARNGEEPSPEAAQKAAQNVREIFAVNPKK